MFKAFEASVGIDIAKAKVDVAALDASNSPKHRTFTNDLEGFTAFTNNKRLHLLEA